MMRVSYNTVLVNMFAAITTRTIVHKTTAIQAKAKERFEAMIII